MQPYERKERGGKRKQRRLARERSPPGGSHSDHERRSPDLQLERRSDEQAYLDREWEDQGHEWDQPGYDRLGPEHGWKQPGYGGERQGYHWELQGGVGLGRAPGAEKQPWRQTQQGKDGASRKRGAKGSQRSDERIREDVCEALTQHPWINACEIEVRVQNGQVFLQGTVKRREMRHMAEECTETILGVKGVENYIRFSQSS